MAIDYNLARAKINELNRTAITLVDGLVLLERDALLLDSIPVPLTPGQVSSLQSVLEAEANDLKVIAGEIKDIVKPV